MTPRAPTIKVEAVGDGRVAAIASLPGEYLAILRWDVRSPVGGPEELTIRLDQSGEGWVDSGGVTVDVLRAVPLRDMRHAMLAELPALAAAMDPAYQKIVKSADVQRVGRQGRSAHFYAQIASDYVDLVKVGERHPVVKLAALQGISHETMRHRVKRMRWATSRKGGLGLLTGPPTAPELTERAKQLLREGSGGD